MAFHVVFCARRRVEKTLLGVFLLFAGGMALGNVPQLPDWIKEKVPPVEKNALGGSFMSVDPVLTDNNTGASFNRYVYALNNPYSKIDRDGRDPEHAYVPGGMSREEYASINAGVGEGVTRSLLTIGRFFPQTATISAVLMAALDSAPPATAGASSGATASGSSSDLATPIRGASGGPRAGKAFTQKGKQEVKKENADKNGGKNKCQNCDKETAPGQQSKSGVTPPGNETQVDHITAKSKGGNGSPDNGQILCRDCNIKKSDN
jgi:uncharacterized protein RhaS with RHS repeats